MDKDMTDLSKAKLSFYEVIKSRPRIKKQTIVNVYTLTTLTSFITRSYQSLHLHEEWKRCPQHGQIDEEIFSLLSYSEL